MQQRINLAHGEGGELTHKLIKEVFEKAFGHGEHTKYDAPMLECKSEIIAFTTDSYVVKPIFFPGGNIGKLAVTGTVNDLAVSGAVPKYMTAGFIIEEGLSLRYLKEVVDSMAAEAKKAGIRIIAGDTKVVEKGSADQLFINTAGVGILESGQKLHQENIQEGDSIILSGTIGDHGIAIVSAREELGLISDIKSDCASLNGLIQELLQKVKGIRVIKDPTRGGLATALVELCEDFHFTSEILEESIPIRNDVHGACDILGFDPLYLANEGKMILIVESKNKERVLQILKKHPLGEKAAIIGRVTSRNVSAGELFLKTPLGTTRRLQRLSGMLLPRIC
ncbi:hydrogenase expression/formation protein HypE [Bacillus sp. ISL-47]|uniref:hydrogenase expression/formation protein HypE n=1 Tax=Bacillus sp. ISL-47 TaxID=2819130 RepID=UPI001BEB16BC|nr:hydrogenase expression/formation protein HypE [Bacillus sp. ISL-47]MBT2689540.1 hydrogenase expression/formation protein HypE [Bacillus sp. ISL-47]MBT2708359.1 hydrogenase expression/formation protein HypE [Pseudomonas sp. ISL-84]